MKRPAKKAKRWEYARRIGTTEELNALGAKGWEAYAALIEPGTGMVMHCFKRRLK